MPPPKGNHRRRRPRGQQNAAGKGSVAAPAAVNEHETGSEPQDAVTGPVCPVCASPAADVAAGDCPHVVCASCSHRMRSLYRRRSCVICKVENKHIAVVAASEYVPGVTTASSVREAAARTGRALVHDEATDTFYTDASTYGRFKTIAGFTCPKFVAALGGSANSKKRTDAAMNAVCRAPTHRSIGALRAHVREQHRAVFCDVCVSSKVEYKSMLPIFPLDSHGNGKKSSALMEHIKREHPPCKFCGTHFLDDEDLFNHLQKSHESCHICERRGRSHEYFRNYASLESHYRSQHYVCEDPSCRGEVFENVLDLQGHINSRHRGNLPRNARGRQRPVDISELQTQGTQRPGGNSRASRSGAASASGSGAAPAPAFMSVEDIRQEQERQAERHAGLQEGLNSGRVVGSRTAAPAQGPADRSGASVGSSRNAMRGSSESARASSEATAGMPSVETVASRRGRQRGNGAMDAQTVRQLHSDSAGGGGGLRSSEEGQRAANNGGVNSERVPEAPDDGAFYQRPSPQAPEETAARNKKLVLSMKSALDAAEFEQFRSLSGDFRQKRITAEDYYDAAIESFGVRKAVRDILPEICALLPSPELRKALAMVCSRRHPAPLTSNTSSSNGPSAGGVDRGGFSTDSSRPLGEASYSAGSFPSLSGGSSSSAPLSGSATPRMPIAPPTRNDFPRLGKVNKPEGAPASSQHSRRGQTSSSRGAAQQRESAASVLMQPNMGRVFGASPNQDLSREAPLAQSSFPALGGSTNDAGRSSSVNEASKATEVSAAPDLGAEPFPSLVSSRNGPETQAGSSSVIGGGSGSQAQRVAPAPDVSDRAGAVWGGAASRGGKKRGPGRGGNAGTTMDHPPTRKIVGEFPTLGPSGRGSSASQAGEAASSSRAKVVDVAAMAKSRQAKNALPRVAGGGSYGFAWDRKKARNKQREVKREVKAQQETLARGPGNTADRSVGVSSLPSDRESSAAPSETISVNSDGTVGASGATGDAEARQSHVGESSSAQFDQFGYLHSDSPRAGEGGSDPTSSFFGS